MMRESITIRFAGDSGDGVQLLGNQFLVSSAKSGQNFMTFPDYPAEIRAPAGTTYGVSAYQIQIGELSVKSPGDEVDVLVAFNPAALKTNLHTLSKTGLIVINEDNFGSRNLKKAGYLENPLLNDSLSFFQTVVLPISSQTKLALKDLNLSNSESARAENFWVLGLILWMFDRETETISDWITHKFSNAMTSRANQLVLKAGHAFGEINEVEQKIPRLTSKNATYAPGRYRAIRGSEALSLGLIAASELSSKPILFCSYPITPASPLLHALTKQTDCGVRTFQAEDEIAAICAAIGASYAGILGVTSSSGPGIALKTEALGLALSAELPLLVINSQRGGPSTGLPTKTEQSDLLQAVYGRNGDSPIPVLASRSPSDNFDVAIEAVRIAIEFMTPVMLLTDGYLVNASEPWKLPKIDAYKKIIPRAAYGLTGDSQAMAYDRDPITQARTWVKPGDTHLMYRAGGLEKDFHSGNISYDPSNHEAMTNMRSQKMIAIQDDLSLINLTKDELKNEGLIISWGSTFGCIQEALQQKEVSSVSHINLRYLNPLPKNLKSIAGQFEWILVPELNQGQLSKLLRAELAIDLVSYSKVQGLPFKVSEIIEKIHQLKRRY
jgi:2-oxoglutarate/2-oxoacid ferredoxin oxidoreductase subunit alpha